MKVKYFMWAFQPHFQGDVVYTATSVLKKLDERFEAEAFLVGFRRTDDGSGFPIGIEPDYSAYQPDLFASVPERAKLLMQSDPANNSIHTHHAAQERHLEKIRVRAYRRAIREVVDGAMGATPMVNFVTGPVEVNDYSVYIVLQLQDYVYNSIYRLKIDTKDGMGVECSLVDATIQELLGAFVKDLTLSSESGFMRLDQGELIRTAAKGLMYTPASAGGEMNALHGLYEACQAISTLTYESAEGIGTIAIARKHHPAIRVWIELNNPVPLDNYGAVRKLLQLASDRMALLSDSSVVYGLGEALPSYDPMAEDLFQIRFRRQFVWDLVHANWTMMHVRFGQPELKAPGFDRERFERDTPRILQNIGANELKTLGDLAARMASDAHGALLIVSDDAKSESARLQKQGMQVTPFRLTTDNISWVTSIDGAVLSDAEGNCFALGVILDGLASDRCLPSRGARFNSAIRYVYSDQGRLAIVKSEDGTISVIPQLRPQLQLSDIEDKLREFRELAESDFVTRRVFAGLMRWFERHRFYLSPELCDELNRLRSTAEDKFDDKDSGFRFAYHDFVPHPEMNNTYLID